MISGLVFLTFELPSEMYVTTRANLNKSYFKDRQDRYLYFAGQKDLASYCFEFIQTVTRFSYKLLPATPSPTSQTPSPNPHTYTYEDYTLHWPNSNTHPHYINAIAESSFTQFQKRHRERLMKSLHTATSPTENTLLIPVIQAGQFNIREEETAFELLFRLLNRKSIRQRPLLDLTSGYFSLYTPYQNFILSATKLDCRIVAASPKVGSCTSIIS
jgi:CDP-diacylglycerol--glycerol-3-phosphate 3-phosphatidyltransferase